MDKFLIRRYLDGQCSAEEKAAAERYIVSADADKTLLQEALELAWNEEPAAHFPAEKAALLLRLHERMAESAKTAAEPTVTPVVSMPVHRKWKKYLMGAAAAVALVIVVPAIRNGNNKHRQQQADDHQSQWTTIRNEGRKNQLATLPDNTKVWLTPDASLSYLLREDAQERLTKLEGEAFFEVAHDPGKPFKVITGSVITKVLGTEFNVEAYPDEYSVRISLVKGKVTLQHADIGASKAKPIDTLKAGQMITCDKRSFAAVREVLHNNAKEDWINGALVFNEIPVKDALERVAKRFGLHLEIDNNIQLGNKRISATFRSESPAPVFDNICFITDCTWQQRGDTIGLIQAGH